MYDTSNPYEWKYYKTVDYPFGQWTITDATLSPDNRFLAYSSIRNLVCLASTDPADESYPTILDLSVAPGGRSRRGYLSSYFGVRLDLPKATNKEHCMADDVVTDLVSPIFGRRSGNRSWYIRSFGCRLRYRDKAICYANTKPRRRCQCRVLRR